MAVQTTYQKDWVIQNSVNLYLGVFFAPVLGPQHMTDLLDYRLVFSITYRV